jgi:hypothetical protein
MTTSKAEKARIKRKSEGWEPTQEDLDTIINRLKFTGQKGISELNKPLYKKICGLYKKMYPEDSVDSLSYKYFTTVKYLRNIFRENRIEFMRWISSPGYFFEIDRSIDTFFKCGYVSPMVASAAEDDQGGFFKWVEDATIELVLVSRGTGKTTKWTCMRALWLVVNYPEYKWLVVHSDKDRAKSLLKSIKDMMINPYLELIFPDLFSDDAAIFKSRKGNILTNEKINVVTFNEETEETLRNGNLNSEFRKEATFTVGSPQIDRTSWHFEGVLFDDLVIDDTSRSPKVTRQLESYFRSLFAMKQYRDGWKFRCYGTGTEWWQDSLYSIIKGMPNASVFEAPAKWKYKNKDIRLCRFFDDSMLADTKSELGDWFDSQMMMKPRPFENEELDLGFTGERNIVKMSLAELEALKAEHMVAQICDPSYSWRNKTKGDKKSRFTILHAVVSEENFYVYSGWQCYGKDTAGIKDTNRAFAKKEKIDFFIQDAQAGAQSGLFDEQIVLMRDDMPTLRYFKHDRRAIVGQGKMGVANAVLKDLFLTRDLYIVEIENDPDEERVKAMKTLKEQLMGVGGLDFVDCMVYMVADIDRSFDVNIARMTKKLKHKDREQQSMSFRNNNNRVFGRLA